MSARTDDNDDLADARTAIKETGGLLTDLECGLASVQSYLDYVKRDLKNAKHALNKVEDSLMFAVEAAEAAERAEL